MDCPGCRKEFKFDVSQEIDRDVLSGGRIFYNAQGNIYCKAWYTYEDDISPMAQMFENKTEAQMLEEKESQSRDRGKQLIGKFMDRIKGWFGQSTKD
jgi:hypothetical protein